MTSDGLNRLETAHRRNFLRAAGLLVGSVGVAAASGVAFGAPQAKGRGKPGDLSRDVGIMQGALALEHEGIAAYQIAGASGLLKPETLKTALVFLGHHKQHRDSLAALIKTAGGVPVEAKTDAQYTTELSLASLKSEKDVVVLATKLEKGATNAYAGQVAALQDPKLAHLFTQLATDEAVHWATLNNALSQPIPAQAYLFG